MTADQWQRGKLVSFYFYQGGPLCSHVDVLCRASFPARLWRGMAGAAMSPLERAHETTPRPTHDASATGRLGSDDCARALGIS